MSAPPRRAANGKGSRKNNFGIRPPIHQFCLRRSSNEWGTVFQFTYSARNRL